MARGGSPLGALLFPAAPYLSSSLFTVIPLYLPLSQFTPPISFPKEVNKTLSYGGQNAPTQDRERTYTVFIRTSV